MRVYLICYRLPGDVLGRKYVVAESLHRAHDVLASRLPVPHEVIAVERINPRGQEVIVDERAAKPSE